MSYQPYIGVDAGGTMTKIAYFEEGKLRFRKFLSSELTAAAEWMLGQFQNPKIHVTGGKGALLCSYLPMEVGIMNEFEATCSGVKHLLKLGGHACDDFILTNVGTGTSLHYINKDEHIRIGGTGVGGGTIMGLSHLLTNVSHYDELVKLGQQGSRQDLDLKVSQIYEGALTPISGDLTASNFGGARNLQSNPGKADLLAGVFGLVGETVAVLSVQAADQYKAQNIVYIGSSFIQNELLINTVLSYTRLKEQHGLVLPNGEFSGAIGSLLKLL